MVVKENKTDWSEIQQKLEQAKLLLNKKQQHSSEDLINILKKRTAQFAIDTRKQQDQGEMVSLIEFELGQETYAIESRFLKEVLKSDTIYDLPCTPNFVYGVVNLRGKIVTVIDLKKYLQLNYVGISDLAAIIIVEYKNSLVGFVADKIFGIKDMPLKSIQASKPKLQKIKESFLVGITKDTTIVLAINKLLEEKSILVNNKIE